MKRKKWPQLLMQELVGAAVWCLTPYEGTRLARRSKGCGWKIAFASPAIHELLGYKPEEAEGLDWADIITATDLPRLVESMESSIAASESPFSGSNSHHKHKFRVSNSRTSSLGDLEDGSMTTPPTGPFGLGMFSGPSKQMSIYTRMVQKDGLSALFELRGHAYFGDEGPEISPSPETNGGFDGGGVMGVNPSVIEGRNRRRSHPDERTCKAFWVMGRKWTGQGDGGGKMLDTFLELKMENERLKQELRELYARPPTKEPGGHARQVSSTARPGESTGARPIVNKSTETEDSDDQEEDELDDGPSSRSGMASTLPPGIHAGAAPPDEKKLKRGKFQKAPEYLCRNCGRNDSPEWRKGPLGPKTLCNVSNSTCDTLLKSVDVGHTDLSSFFFLPKNKTKQKQIIQSYPGLWSPMGETKRCTSSETKRQGKG